MSGAVRSGIIDGDSSLPAGFAHPHASEEARVIAEQGLILRAQVGSGVHGTAISGQDDRDEMGIALEPAAHVTGLTRVPAGTGCRGRRCLSSSTSGTPSGTLPVDWPTGRVPATWT